jgi:hypothetical protein
MQPYDEVCPFAAIRNKGTYGRSAYVGVELALLYGECLNEVHMVMKRRTRAVRRQTNFIELACTAVLLVADIDST